MYAYPAQTAGKKICCYNKKFISDPNSSITGPFGDFLSNFLKHYHLRSLCKYSIDLKITTDDVFLLERRLN